MPETDEGVTHVAVASLAECVVTSRASDLTKINEQLPRMDSNHE